MTDTNPASRSTKAIPGLVPFDVPTAVIDIETTGLDARRGDRIVDIALVVISGPRAGETWQQYVNPERDVPDRATQIHGLDNTFLVDKPKIAAVAPEFLEVLASLGKETCLVAHNGNGFDYPFLNHELSRTALPSLDQKTCYDSLELARYLYPNRGNSLDALCERLHVNKSVRTKHGALVDCQLLAQVYLTMVRSVKIPFDTNNLMAKNPATETPVFDTHTTQTTTTPSNPKLRRMATKDEESAHNALLDTMLPTAVWKMKSS